MLEIKYQAKNVPINQCFEYLSGNTGLTVRTIHNSKGKNYDCTVLSSSLMDSTSLGYIDSKTILPNGKQLKLFKDKEGIVVSRNGYAGTMSYLKPGLYTLTDHAYILYKSVELKYDIDLNWFILEYQNDIRKRFLTTQSGNQTFTITKFMKQFKIDIPTIEFQKELSQKYRIIEKEMQAIKEQKDKIIEFNLENITGYKMIDVPLFSIFEPHQGNAIFTKKNINNNGWKGNIPVISSNTDNNGILDYVDIKYVKEKDYVKTPCLTWSVDGYAGKLFARNIEPDPIGFVANNHCGILHPIIDIKNIYFPYLVYNLQPQFFKNAKNDANKKLGNNQMTDIIVSIPVTDSGDYDLNAQIEIANKYQSVEKLKEQLLSKIDELLNIEIDFM